ncbi:MAG: hypothetical protein ACK559_41985 [bacterium]
MHRPPSERVRVVGEVDAANGRAARRRLPGDGHRQRPVAVVVGVGRGDVLAEPVGDQLDQLAGR